MTRNFTAIGLIFFLLLAAPGVALGQGIVKGDPDVAAEFYSNRNYKAALNCYLLLLKKDPKNVDYNHKAGKCYLLSHSIKAKAIPLLEFVVKQPKFDADAWYDLGRAYHFGNQFDKAIDCYNKFKEKNPKKADEIDRLIEQCLNGKLLVKTPMNVTYENLGKGINSPFPDYYPFVTPDDNTLFFTTRRQSSGGQELDGYFPSDIFMVTKKADLWGKAASIGGNINTGFDEQVTGISPDGNRILYYIDHVEPAGDILESKRINGKGQFLKPLPLNPTINAGFETSANYYVSGDGENEILFFSSSRPENNLGQTDIYYCRRVPKPGPNGEVIYDWGLPISCGPNVNTKYKEEFPSVSSDGKTLYFASEGHSSMGGFDLFKSVWDEDAQQWSKPRNLGYPINTPDDELNISFLSSGRVAYISAMREDGLGDLDIYRITFEDIEGQETIFRGLVLGDSVSRLKNATIQVDNKKTNETYGTYMPDKNKGYYVMALPPGKWHITIEADGYKIYEEDIILFDFVGFKPEVEKNFILKK